MASCLEWCARLFVTIVTAFLCYRHAEFKSYRNIWQVARLSAQVSAVRSARVLSTTVAEDWGFKPPIKIFFHNKK